MVTRARLLDEVYQEVSRANELYHHYHSCHEGWAVIREELDELWDEIKASKGIRCTDDMRKEAIQVAATAIRFIEDLYE